MDAIKKEVEERIVMTPTKKGRGHTTIRMERVKQMDMDSSTVMHVAGGDHKGIIINREAAVDEDMSPSQLSLEFKVFLTNAANDLHTQESRQLRFWFRPEIQETQQMHTVQDFFKELVSPHEFPRDYVGFIKKIMKLMQLSYIQIRKIEVEMKQLDEMIQPPTRPTMPNGVLINVGPLRDGGGSRVPPAPPKKPAKRMQTPIEVSMDDSFVESKIQLTPEKVLEMIESAYPNPLPVTDIAKSCQSTEEEVHFYLHELELKRLIKCLETGLYTRVTANDMEVKLVRQMPAVNSSQQPTIAIITAQYCEKLAVDAMIDHKDTYVRYKTEGESNVYTLGNIGPHRVVSTKLPAVGHARGAMIAAGNTTTRLLGTFQRVEYVFLVGVGGGVPHYTDYNRHVRIGDVVVATPPGNGKNQIYMYCEKIKNSPESNGGTICNSADKFNIKSWSPASLEIQMVARHIWDQGMVAGGSRPWEHYLTEGLAALKDQESDFSRPCPENDKLFMSIGGKDVIEVNHPSPPEGVYNPRESGMPVVHFGMVGSGRMLMRDDAGRMEFANQHGILAFDTEFDAVVESVFGNRKDNYTFVRGIADYKDGTKRRDWQPFSALAAAAFMRATICAMDPYEEE